MDENVKSILKMLEEGKISSEEAESLMSKIKPNQQSTANSSFNDFADYVKKLELKEKADNFIKSPTMQNTVTSVKSTVDNVINKIENLQEGNFIFKNKYEVKPDAVSSLNLYASKSNITISTSYNDCLYISMSYRSKANINAVNFIMENDKYFFDFDKYNHSSINYFIEVPERMFNEININGGSGNINFQGVNLIGLVSVNLEKAVVSLTKVYLEEIDIKASNLNVATKNSNIQTFNASGSSIRFNSSHSDFFNLTVISHNGNFILNSSRTVFINKNWNIEYYKGFITVKIPKDKSLSRRICINANKGKSVVKLRKMRYTSRVSEPKILEDKDYFMSLNKVFISATNFNGGIIIKN